MKTATQNMQKRSENIKAFLDFIRECQSEYNSAYETVGTEDKRTQDLLHAIEFEPLAKERSKICTKLKTSRMTRRENKDAVEELEPIVELMSDPMAKKTIDKLTQVLGKVRKVEEYHERRSYTPRVNN